MFLLPSYWFSIKYFVYYRSYKYRTLRVQMSQRKTEKMKYVYIGTIDCIYNTASSVNSNK